MQDTHHFWMVWDTTQNGVILWHPRHLVKVKMTMYICLLNNIPTSLERTQDQFNSKKKSRFEKFVFLELCKYIHWWTYAKALSFETETGTCLVQSICNKTNTSTKTKTKTKSKNNLKLLSTGNPEENKQGFFLSHKSHVTRESFMKEYHKYTKLAQLYFINN